MAKIHPALAIIIRSYNAHQRGVPENIYLEYELDDDFIAVCFSALICAILNIEICRRRTN